MATHSSILAFVNLMDREAKRAIVYSVTKNRKRLKQLSTMAENEEELKSLLMRVNKESEKASLKLNTKIMASGPITSWQINGEKMETVTAFIFLGSKITANSDCSHEIKRHLLLRRKAMTNLDSKLKSRHITLLTKVHLVKAMCFSSSHTWI